jgi:hypothetical protein
MASKSLSSSISYSSFPAHDILSLLSLDNIDTETKTANMKQLKTELESIRQTVVHELHAFQALADKYIPQIEESSDLLLQSFKYKAIVQSLEHGRVEHVLFTKLQSNHLIVNNRFESHPDLFNMIPQQQKDTPEGPFVVRTVCYDTFVEKLQLLNRYTYELQTAVQDLDNRHINEETRPYLTVLFKALDITKDGSLILEKLKDVFDRYSGIKSGIFSPYLKKKDETKAYLIHIKQHTFQRGLDMIARCEGGILPTTFSAALSKVLRYSPLNTSPPELDVLSSNDAYIEELEALSSTKDVEEVLTTSESLSTSAPPSSTSPTKTPKKK